jgi:hypothetical protein
VRRAQLKTNNIVKKNKAQASFYKFSIIPNPKQHLCLPRWFRNPKLEECENWMEVL